MHRMLSNRLGMVTNDVLEQCIARVFDSDRRVRQLTERVLRLQRQLQRELDDRAWLIYLRLEATVNHRHDEVLRGVVARLGDAIMALPRG